MFTYDPCDIAEEDSFGAVTLQSPRVWKDTALEILGSDPIRRTDDDIDIVLDFLPNIKVCDFVCRLVEGGYSWLLIACPCFKPNSPLLPIHGPSLQVSVNSEADEYL